MANPHRGETSVEIGGRTYVLVFGTNECVELEQLLGRTSPVIFAEMKRWKDEPELITAEMVRALTWAALRKHHKLSIEAVGDLMDEASRNGVVIPVLDALANSASVPQGEDGGETKGERPTRQTTNGAGTTPSETSSLLATAAISSGTSLRDR